MNNIKAISKEFSVHLTVVDGLFVLMSIVLIYASNDLNQHSGLRPFVMVEPLLIAYYVLRILFNINHKWTSYLLLLVIAAFCVKETYLGYFQLFQNLGKINGQEICKGSFSNSGPFGCFLSLCASLFIAVSTGKSNKIIRIPLAILTALASILMVSTLSRASVFSFAVSMFFLFMKKDKFSAFIRKNRIYLILAVSLLGAGAYLVKKPSADGRLLMARINMQMIMKGGLSGAGWGNYGGAYGEAQAHFFADYLDSDSDEIDIERIPENLRRVADCPTNAFNEYLKMGVESGPIAMILLVGLVVTGIISAYRSDNYWCYPLITVSVFACFSYPFQVGVLLLLFIICLASTGSENESKGTRMSFFLIMIAVLIPVYRFHVSVVNGMDFRFRASGIKGMFENRQNRYAIFGYGSLPDGLYDEKVIFEYGQSLNASGNYTMSDSLLAIGTSISCDPMFWNVMGNNSLLQGKYREAEQRYKHAFYIVPNRLYPLYLMAKLYYAEGDTARFLNMADKIESFVPKVESVQTERLRSEIRELKTGY
jgi:tetratricopeptide (TPR) repeat protein